MNRIDIRLSALALIASALLVGTSPLFEAAAQGPSTTATAPQNAGTIRALQDALNKQGIAIKVDGVLDDETRSAIRKFQTQHHVPVTGEPDKATLDKLGVSQSAAPIQGPVTAQANPIQPAPPSGPGVTNCPMMQGQMQSMMQMMQGMMQTMQMMQAQMQPGQMPGRAPTGN